MGVEAIYFLNVENARLKELLELARDYIECNRGGWCRDGIRCYEILSRIRDEVGPALPPEESR